MKRLIYPFLILSFMTMACFIGSIGKPAPTATAPVVEEPSATPLFEVPTDIPVVEMLPEDTPLPVEPTAAPPEPPTPSKINPTATTQIQGGNDSGGSYFNEDFTANIGNWRQWVPAGDPAKNYVKVVLGRLRFELPIHRNVRLCPEYEIQLLRRPDRGQIRNSRDGRG